MQQNLQNKKIYKEQAARILKFFTESAEKLSKYGIVKSLVDCDIDVYVEKVEDEYEEDMRKYEEDMLRQMRNLLRYNGTDEGQEGEIEE